jgi:hypothetical protein
MADVLQKQIRNGKGYQNIQYVFKKLVNLISKQKNSKNSHTLMAKMNNMTISRMKKRYIITTPFDL